MSQPYGYPGSGAPVGAPPQLRPPGGVVPGYPYRPGMAPAPYPVPNPQPYLAPLGTLRRPATVTMAATMAVTASLQFVCVLSFVWLVAFTGLQDLPNRDLNADSAIYHLCRRFHLAMLDGLAWPLYLIPTAAFVPGFVILVPRAWTRWALTLVGVGALAWSGIWLHRQIMWWIPAALYILVACLLLWTPAATAWYRGRGRTSSRTL